MSDSEEEDDGVKATKKLKHEITDSENEVDDQVTKLKIEKNEQEEEGEEEGENKQFEDSVTNEQQENEDSDDGVIADTGL